MGEHEKIHLQKVLNEIDTFAAVPDVFDFEDDRFTPKVRTLIEFLKDKDDAFFAGLIFVRTRAEVAILSQLLLLHPLTRSFAVSTFVGESSYSTRKANLGELIDVRNQKTTLDDLRQGTKNLVITTNALEEGIDVSACNVVICFEKPPNLKSFVQRRGRARKDISTYAIMLEETKDVRAVTEWQELENLMRKIYEDETRKLQQLQKLENEEAEGEREFSVATTGYDQQFSLRRIILTEIQSQDGIFRSIQPFVPLLQQVGG